MESKHQLASMGNLKIVIVVLVSDNQHFMSHSTDGSELKHLIVDCLDLLFIACGELVSKAT